MDTMYEQNHNFEGLEAPVTMLILVLHVSTVYIVDYGNHAYAFLQCNFK